MLTLSHVLKALAPAANYQITQDFEIACGCVDSRCVNEKGLFVALRGENTDGHQFVDQAFANGAVLALIDHPIDSQYPVVDLNQEGFELPKCTPFSLQTPDALTALQTVAKYWRQQHNLTVIGITGSVGKSSTKELIASVLGSQMKTLKNQGNMNNEIGLPLTLLSLTEEHKVAVLEMGFYVAGEIKLLCDIAQPQIGIVSNVGTVHAERAGSIESIALGKAELVESLPASPNGLAILNYDDPFVRDMVGLTEARIFYYGLDPEADLWADKVESRGLDGIRCRMHYQDESLYVTAPLIGRHSVYTMLRAAAIALNLGMDWGAIFEAFKDNRVQLRIVTVQTASGAVLIDDTYNASPDSTMAALNLLDDLKGRKVAVLGDMLELGRYEEAGHNKIGMRASEVADEIVLVGTRSLMTRDAAVENGFPADMVHWFSDYQGATAYLLETLKSGDIALIKGSHSMHMEKIVSALEDVD
ncbi:MAG TPA: UDP-N-acetylmuramoyl-tripeptide--D-alanyl-D-alanine ligase [Anaerolineaceae bacterium]|nr:UDP-N-acetylmuramoyl-tripeptide--D-alanyl-D-alanine ligase [Anaerolineaceae bacterium]